MKKEHLLLPFFLFLGTLLVGQTSLAPSVIAADGGRIESAEMTLDWTLGETIAGEGAALGGVRMTDGFHQPTITVEVVLAADQAATPRDLEIDIFPNPVIEKLVVQVRSAEIEAFELRFLNASGLELERWTKKTTAAPLEISMQPRAAGLYFLQFFSPDGKHIGSRKIVLTK